MAVDPQLSRRPCRDSYLYLRALLAVWEEVGARALQPCPFPFLAADAAANARQIVAQPTGKLCGLLLPQAHHGQLLPLLWQLQERHIQLRRLRQSTRRILNVCLYVHWVDHRLSHVKRTLGKRREGHACTVVLNQYKILNQLIFCLFIPICYLCCLSTLAVHINSEYR